MPQMLNLSKRGVQTSVLWGAVPKCWTARFKHAHYSDLARQARHFSGFDRLPFEGTSASRRKFDDGRFWIPRFAWKIRLQQSIENTVAMLALPLMLRFLWGSEAYGGGSVRSIEHRF